MCFFCFHQFKNVEIYLFVSFVFFIIRKVFGYGYWLRVTVDWRFWVLKELFFYGFFFITKNWNDFMLCLNISQNKNYFLSELKKGKWSWLLLQSGKNNVVLLSIGTKQEVIGFSTHLLGNDYTFLVDFFLPDDSYH